MFTLFNFCQPRVIFTRLLRDRFGGVFVLLAVFLWFLPRGNANGQSWRLIFPEQAFTVAVNPMNSNVLYVGNQYNVVYKSGDGGQSWQMLEVLPMGGGSAMTSIVVNSADTNVVLVGGFLFNGVYRSGNGGTTWTQALRDSVPRRNWFISDAIIEDPFNPSVYLAVRGSSINNIYRSADTGKTWDSIATIEPSITTRLCTIAARTDSANIFYTGCIGGVIMRSTDGGISWNTVPVLNGAMRIKDGAEIPKIVFSKSNPQLGYAVVTISSEDAIEDSGGLLRTTDGGLNWDRIALSDTSFWAVEVRPSPLDFDEIFLGGFRQSNKETVIKGDSLVLRSVDGGTHWTRFENIPWNTTTDGDTIKNVWMLRHDPLSNRMYMATQVGLYVLDEGVNSLPSNPKGVPSSEQRVASASASASISAAFSNGLVTFLDALCTLHPVLCTLQPIRWSVYSMNGARITSGGVPDPTAHEIHVGSLPSGTYLIVIGNERYFCTLGFVVTN